MRGRVRSSPKTLKEQNPPGHVAPPGRCIMKETVDRVMKAFATRHKAMTPEQERRVRDEVSDFVAELLEKRADQLARFGDRRLRGTEPQI